MREVVTGNLGTSSQGPRPVAEIIGDAIPVTLGLVAFAFAVALIAGTAFGLISIKSQRSFATRSLSGIPIFLASIPPVFLALWGIYAFALRLRWLPPFGLWTPGADTSFGLDLIHHLVLPTIALALPFLATYMRHARQMTASSFAEESGPTVSIEGTGEPPQRSQSGLRTDVVSLLRILSLSLPPLIGSAIVVETLLSLGGLGHVAYVSLVRRDPQVLLAALLAAAAIVLAARLLTDVLLGWLEPSIRGSSGNAAPMAGRDDAASRQIGPPLEFIDRPLKHRPWSSARRDFLAHRPALVGLVIFVGFVTLAVLGPFAAPYSPHKTVPLNTLAEPSASHWLGTDSYGRDVYSLVLHGARRSLGVGVWAVGISLLIGMAIGVPAGSHGGRIDTVLMRITDLATTFPALLLVLVIVVPMLWVIGPEILLAVMIGVVGWPGFARLIRRQVVLRREAADSQDSAGAERDRPETGRRDSGSLGGPLAVAVAYGLAAALLAEATLAFLGIGVTAFAMSWGQMVRQASGIATLTSPAALVPTILIVLLVLSVYLIGDGLRNAFDARRTEPRPVGSGDEPAAPDGGHGSP